MADRDQATTVQLKVRMKEPLRADLEKAAHRRGVSMNAEIVRRLERSFERRDHTINGVAIGAELYLVMRELASFQRRINTALSSSQDAPALREEVISAALGLSSSQDRIVNVLQALLPADKGLVIDHRADDDIRIVARTIQDEDK
jgi:Arc-like DNA binding domain